MGKWFGREKMERDLEKETLDDYFEAECAKNRDKAEKEIEKGFGLPDPLLTRAREDYLTTYKTGTYSPAYSPTPAEYYTCKRCGSMVDEAQEEKHSEWHVFLEGEFGNAEEI